MKKTTNYLAIILSVLFFSGCANNEFAYDFYKESNVGEIREPSFSINSSLKSKMYFGI